MREELWKDVPGFEDCFQISNLGRIKRKAHRTISGDKHMVGERILQPVKCKNGYYEAQLNYKGKRTVFLLHRLVAECFVENPLGLPEINHKDENLANNRADNLEWCTHVYNCNYGTRNARSIENHNYRKINQYSLEGYFIRQWGNATLAGRSVGVGDECILRACSGKQLTSCGFKWKFANECIDSSEELSYDKRATFPIR